MNARKTTRFITAAFTLQLIATSTTIRSMELQDDKQPRQPAQITCSLRITPEDMTEKPCAQIKKNVYDMIASFNDYKDGNRKNTKWLALLGPLFIRFTRLAQKDRGVSSSITMGQPIIKIPDISLQTCFDSNGDPRHWERILESYNNLKKEFSSDLEEAAQKESPLLKEILSIQKAHNEHNNTLIQITLEEKDAHGTVKTHTYPPE